MVMTMIVMVMTMIVMTMIDDDDDDDDDGKKWMLSWKMMITEIQLFVFFLSESRGADIGVMGGKEKAFHWTFKP